ncbi:MAG: SET domain-containing protein-lysine N-methyltransferase [Alphaproteobacteria bacterium]|nr:MAG: SET domain-containing protein-lysine N-methyltransferase [Alphaproteobacteria bacterium]
MATVMATFLPHNPKIALDAIAGKGRGIVARVDLAASETVDVAATIDLDAADCAALDGTPAGEYYFAHPTCEERGLLVLGIPSLLNHSDFPNVRVDWRFDPTLGWLAATTTLRPVKAGEELLRTYACAPWFRVAS